MRIFRMIHFRIPHYADHHRHVVHGVHTTLFGSEFIEAHGVTGYLAGIACLLGAVAYFVHLDIE